MHKQLIENLVDRDFVFSSFSLKSSQLGLKKRIMEKIAKSGFIMLQLYFFDGPDASIKKTYYYNFKRRNITYSFRSFKKLNNVKTKKVKSKLHIIFS